MATYIYILYIERVLHPNFGNQIDGWLWVALVVYAHLMDLIKRNDLWH